MTVVCLAAVLAACPRREPPADLVLRGGVVYTVDDARSTAEAVAVRQGRIVFVGGDSGAARLVGPETRVVELAGRLVLPGFHDAHVHPLASGMRLALCDLEQAADRDQALAMVREYAESHPEAEWIRGGGFQLPIFAGGLPHRRELDSVVGDRPAFLVSADGHSAWVSTRALAVAGIGPETPDPPPDGRIEHDADGTPNGTLREAAMGLVGRHLPEPTVEERADGLRRALELAGRYGITSWVDASADEAAAAAYLALADRGELSVRTVLSLSYAAVRDEEEPFARLEAWRARFHGPRLEATAVKLFADGVIEGRTAALLEPYAGDVGRGGTFRGDLVYPPEELERIVTELDSRGFQVHIHAIGDRGVRAALDALEAAQRASPARDRRHHIAHLQLVDPADYPRFAALGVTANIQALWAFYDSYMTDLTVPVLGPERAALQYPFESLEAAGAVLVGGSDWAVSSLDPLQAIEVALTRQSPEGEPTEPFYPAQRMSLASMLAAYTRSGAFLVAEDDETGTIELGKAADLIVLDLNLLDLEPRRISEAKVLLTLVDGAPTFADPALWR